MSGVSYSAHWSADFGLSLTIEYVLPPQLGGFPPEEDPDNPDPYHVFYNGTLRADPFDAATGDWLVSETIDYEATGGDVVEVFLDLSYLDVSAFRVEWSIDSSSYWSLAESGTVHVQNFAASDTDALIRGHEEDDVILSGDFGDTVKAGSGNDWVLGGDSTDVLFGNAGADALDGAGGADILVGGLGDDTYTVGAVGDLVIEYRGEGSGFDTVKSAISWTLPVNVEGLELLGSAGLRGTGNADANRLAGNAGNNVLDGLAGADTMAGGRGDDTYHVDHAGDVVTEQADVFFLNGSDLYGTDTVIATVSCVLASNVENLTLAGTGAIAGTGNALANTLRGNAAANAISGGAGQDALSGGGGADVLNGGADRDLLTGGPGADLFVLSNAGWSGVGAAARDVVLDFTRGTALAAGDRIDLSAIDANGAARGNGSFTFIGTAAFSRTDATGQLRFIQDSASGACIVLGSTDADSAAEFAIQLNGVNVVTAGDLVL